MFIEVIDSVKFLSEEVIFKTAILQADLKRKYCVLKGLLFILKCYEKSTSSNKDQNDEFGNLLASYENLENEHDEATEKVLFLE